MKLRLVLVILVAWLLGSCNSTKERNTTKSMDNEREGVVRGRVTVGPLFPGPVRIDEPERKPPAEFFENHRIRVLSENGGTVITEASIDSDGNYSVSLNAGFYLLDFVPHDTGLRPYIPKKVEVRPGETTVHHIDIDTGMR